MEQIKNSVMELIGKTPMLRLHQYCKEKNILGADLLAKLEYLNPTGSIKDKCSCDDRRCGKKRNFKTGIYHY